MGSLVTWGILSTADINRKVIPGAHASEKVDLVAVASRDRARAEAYAREWEIPRAYGSYEDLLADPEIEAVYISLPNTLHAEWSIKALEAGKHVLCEKPVAMSAAEARELLAVRDRTGVRVQEAFMVRTQGVRRCGSAALDLCYVACGRADGFWEWRLHPWDTAAGSLIVEEAGGTMSDFSGGPFDIFAEQTLASNGLLHQKMVEVLHHVLLEQGG